MAGDDTSSGLAGFGPAGEESRAIARMSGPAAFGLGMLAAVCWLAALALDLQTTRLPGWAREVPHAALTLAVPALIILVAQARSGRRGILRWWVSLLALVVTVIASLPGLLLVSQAQDLAALPLRIPALGLGVALGYVARVAPVRPALSDTRATNGAAQRGWSAAAAGGAGFALLLAPVGLVLVTSAIAAVPACAPAPHQVDCGSAGPGVEMLLEIAICGTALLTVLLALGAAALGGRIGRAIPQFGS